MKRLVRAYAVPQGMAIFSDDAAITVSSLKPQVSSTAVFSLRLAIGTSTG